MQGCCKGYNECRLRFEEDCLPWTWKEKLVAEIAWSNILIDKVKTENLMLLDKIKNLELKLSVAREQTNRSANSKLDHMLSVQKSPLDKIGLGFVDSISVSETHFTNFVSFSEPPKSEIIKPVEVIPPPRKIRVTLRILTSLRIRSMINLCGFAIFVERLGIPVQTVSSCKLQSEQISQEYPCLKRKILWYLLVNW